MKSQNKQQKMQQSEVHSSKTLVEVLRFGLFGAIGFGISFIIFTSPLVTRFFFIMPLQPFFMTVIGGASLGLALRDKNKVVTLALASGFGFLIGYYISGWVVLDYLDLIWYPYGLFIIMAISGTICGSLMGLALKNRKAVLILGVAGFLGFSIGFLISYWITNGSTLVYQMIGGASLGAVLGYLKKKDLIE